MVRRYTAAVTMMLALAVFALPSQAGLGGKRIGRCKTIDKPGSYRLIRNLTTSGDCLVIEADHVTINLNGYRIQGDNSLGSCITDNGDQRVGVVIINGTVTNCFIGLSLSDTDSCKIEEVRALNNVDGGIEVDDGCIVKNNVASGNGGDGIRADDDNVIVQNTASNNSFDGIQAGEDSTIQQNAADGNGSDDIQYDCDSILDHNAADNTNDIC